MKQYSLDTRKLTEKEKVVWDIIKTRYGNDLAITANAIEMSTGINRFALAQIVQSLRLNHKVPVVTNKYGEVKGYFLPTCQKELATTMEEMESQAEKLLDVVTVLYNASKEMAHEQTGL